MPIYQLDTRNLGFVCRLLSLRARREWEKGQTHSKRHWFTIQQLLIAIQKFIITNENNNNNNIIEISCHNTLKLVSVPTTARLLTKYTEIQCGWRRQMREWERERRRSRNQLQYLYRNFNIRNSYWWLSKLLEKVTHTHTKKTFVFRINSFIIVVVYGRNTSIATFLKVHTQYVLQNSSNIDLKSEFSVGFALVMVELPLNLTKTHREIDNTKVCYYLQTLGGVSQFVNIYNTTNM